MTRVLLTRPAGADAGLANLLQADGFEVEAVPTVAIERVDFQPPALELFDWVVVTSPRAVAPLPSPRKPPRWAVVGSASARELARHGVDADFIPSRQDGATLGRELPDVTGRRVLLPRTDAAAAELPRILRRRGAQVTELVVYRTHTGPESSRLRLKAALARGVAVAVFASPSAVAGFIRLAGSPAVPAVVIGSSTEREARRYKFRVVSKAASPEPAALAAAVKEAVAEVVP
jgi:uroporphyrinogen-III synthase